MKVFGLAVLRQKDDEQGAVFLGKALDVTSFNWFKRGFVSEGLNFVMRSFAATLPPQSREVAPHETDGQKYVASGFVNRQGLAAVVIATEDVPQLLTFKLCAMATEAFLKVRRNLVS